MIINLKDDEENQEEKEDEWIQRRGYIIRSVGGYGLKNEMRMKVGKEEENRGVVEEIKEFMK